MPLAVQGNASRRFRGRRGRSKRGAGGVLNQVLQEAEVDFRSLEAANGAAAEALEGGAHLAGDGVEQFPALGGVGWQIGGRGTVPLELALKAGEVSRAEGNQNSSG